jgi:hypothetical protein
MDRSLEAHLQDMMDGREEFYKQADIIVSFHSDEQPISLDQSALRVLLKLKQRLEADNVRVLRLSIHPSFHPISRCEP